MSVCPWCKAEAPFPPGQAGRCPRCGKLAPELPELDLPVDTGPVDARPISGHHELRAPGQARGVAGGAADMDLDDVFGPEGGGAPIELDVAPSAPAIGAVSPRISGSMPAAASHGPRISGTMPAAGPPHAPAVAPAASSALSTSSASSASPASADAVDPFDARALADYGEPPDKWWLTPLYAFRVITRRPAVKRLLAIAKDEAARADGRVEDALVAFAERVRSVVERNPTHARALGDVYAAEQLLRSRDGALAAEMDAHRARVEQIDAQIGGVEAELAKVVEVEARIAGELSRVSAVKERAEAKMRRAEIEIRNAQAALAGPGGSAASGASGAAGGPGGGRA